MSVVRIIVASSKGGIGKSTVSLGVAVALAKKGKKVLLCDLDFDNRCLDIMTGMENKIVNNIADAALKRVRPEDVAVAVDGVKNLLLASAGVGYTVIKKSRAADLVSDEKTIDGDALVWAISEIERIADVDYVVCDTSPGGDIPEILAHSYASRAIIVSSHMPTSVRAAETTAQRLQAVGRVQCRMAICAYDIGNAGWSRTDMIDIIDAARIQIIGIVPFSRLLMLSQEKGCAQSCEGTSKAAFDNIARRICGEEVPLFDNMKQMKKKYNKARKVYK